MAEGSPDDHPAGAWTWNHRIHPVHDRWRKTPHFETGCNDRLAMTHLGLDIAAREVDQQRFCDKPLKEGHQVACDWMDNMVEGYWCSATFMDYTSLANSEHHLWARLKVLECSIDICHWLAERIMRLEDDLLIPQWSRKRRLAMEQRQQRLVDRFMRLAHGFDNKVERFTTELVAHMDEILEAHGTAFGAWSFHFDEWPNVRTTLAPPGPGWKRRRVECTWFEEIQSERSWSAWLDPGQRSWLDRIGSERSVERYWSAFRTDGE